jgi:glycosyltransferase involved in cell wall biosynthesis
MKINIAISAYNRPEYLQRCIAALYGAKGFDKDKYHIYCAMDCYEDGSFNKDVLDVFFWFRLVPDIAKKKQGCNYTVKKALDMAWEDNPDFVLMLEDDIIISDDALMYVEWAAEQYKDDKSVRTIGLWGHDKGYSLGTPIKEKDLGQVIKQNFFTCWGWGTWADRWEEISSKWTIGNDSTKTSWDVVLGESLGDKMEILPSISRAYNCGDIGGTHRGKSWPKVVSSGIVDPDNDVKFWEEEEFKFKGKNTYLILGRFGDIYMIAKKIKTPSIICCLPRFSKIVYELFPEHEVFELNFEETQDSEKDLEQAKIICNLKYPMSKLIVCQQDGQDRKLMKDFKSFQSFQEYYASL